MTKKGVRSANWGENPISCWVLEIHRAHPMDWRTLQSHPGENGLSRLQHSRRCLQLGRVHNLGQRNCAVIVRDQFILLITSPLLGFWILNRHYWFVNLMFPFSESKHFKMSRRVSNENGQQLGEKNIHFKHWISRRLIRCTFCKI